MAKKRSTTYHRILKEFTKINNKLPEEKKLSIKDRRRIIREQIYPNYKGQSEYAYVEWYALDETISELVPDCIYVKVTAGDFGETRIINTRNYEYGRNGVRSIVERIRLEANNSSGRYIFSGYQKLRPRKRNDGTPANYYLDFILFEVDTRGNQLPMGDTESIRFELPKTREVKKKKTKIKNIIEKKIKSLKTKRDSRKRAKATLQKNIDKFSTTVKRVSKAKKPTKSSKELLTKQFNTAIALLERYYAEGKLTQAQNDKALEKILREF